jgi:hypothetical protein
MKYIHVSYLIIRHVLRFCTCVKKGTFRRNFLLPSSLHYVLDVQVAGFLTVLFPVYQTKRCQIIIIFVFIIIFNFIVVYKNLTLCCDVNQF